MPFLTERERIGTRLADKYDLAAVIGRGGMGTVFRGTHAWTGRRVAVKLLKPSFAEDHAVVRRFLKEARAAATVRHPNVVDVLDMGQDADGTVYMVLELLEGESLGSVLKRRTRLTPGEAIDVVRPITEALIEAHDAGFVHRDLKPDNIFLTRGRDGAILPKVLDFGIAKIAEEAGGTSSTRTGAIVGTPHYMSPEQASGSRDVGAQTDVWAIGVVLYECLAGVLPFEADTATGVLVRILTTAPIPLAARAPDVPGALTEIVDAALQPEPSQRIQDMRALSQMLAAAEAQLERDSAERPSLSDLETTVPCDIEPVSSGDIVPGPSDPGASRKRLIESANTMSSDRPAVMPADYGSRPPPPSGPNSAPLAWALVGALGLALVALIVWQALGAQGSPAAAEGSASDDDGAHDQEGATPPEPATAEAASAEAASAEPAIADPAIAEPAEPAVAERGSAEPGEAAEPPSEPAVHARRERRAPASGASDAHEAESGESGSATARPREGAIGVRTEW